MAILRKFLGGTVDQAAGYAAGGAIERTLNPRLQSLENEQWAANPNVPLDPGDAAEIVGEDVSTLPWGITEARQTGLDEDRFKKLVQAVLNAPGTGPLFELWRRRLISRDDFRHGLAKARLEPRWFAALEGLRERLLSPADLAMARQQGFVDDARAREESDLQGVNADRADILFELSGLPPGAETAQAYLNRGLINEDEFSRIIREGHTKTKYTGLMQRGAAAVLSASVYVTANLKGWISDAERDAGGKLTGHTPEQMALMYLAAGRPAAPGQMATAAARGIEGPEGRPMDREQFLKGIRESDIRPEWGPMLWDSRYLYPPLFQISRLVSSGAITADTAAEWAVNDRYPPEVVAALSHFWKQGGGGSSKEATATDELTLYDGFQIDRAELLRRLEGLGYPEADAIRKADVLDARRVVSARTSAIGGIRGAFKRHDITASEADSSLVRVGVAEWARPHIIAAWTAERDAARPELTAAQVVAAYRRAIITRAQALQDLRDRGYEDAAAVELLDTNVVTLTDKQVQEAVGAKVLTRAEGLQRLMQNGHSAADAAILLPPNA